MRGVALAALIATAAFLTPAPAATARCEAIQDKRSRALFLPSRCACDRLQLASECGRRRFLPQPFAGSAGAAAQSRG